MHAPIPRALTAAALTTVVGLAAAPMTATASPPVSAAAAAARLQLGAVTLQRCHLGTGSHAAYCGSIKVPLDYRSTKDGSITIGFGWIPATDAVKSEAPRTLVAEEGGPGYPSTGTAPDYVAMYGDKLLAHNNLLLVDERGTGRSTPIDCKAMEALHIVTQTPAFEKTVRQCGDSLNHEFPRQGGGYVHASDLFTTANAARDLDRVLLALNTGPVDLYGDSYGTYFSQSFLSRFPTMLRSVVLDSAYEARDLDPWYITTVRTARQAFDEVCDRSVACHRAAPSSSWRRITKLAALLRQHPFSGSAVGVDVKPVHVTINVTSLVNIVNDAGYDYDPYRQLDAAARAYLDHRDKTPLLRLYAQDVGYDYSDYNAAASYYSDGQYFAVGCTDYPQLFNMRAKPSVRRAQFAKAEARYPAKAFAPFSIKEWVSMDPFTETYHACTSWPRDVHRADPPVPAHVSMDATHVPVLILNGEIDSLTPAPGGSHIHRQIGSASRHIVTANTVHLVALDTPSSCGRSLMRRFITTPSQLHSMSDSCAPKVRTVRAIGTFPTTVAAAAPVSGYGPRSMRQLASIALAAAGDEAIRYNYVDGNRDLGLRGGTVHYVPAKGTSYTAVLHRVKWTTDSTVSGRVTFTSNAFAGSGVVTISGPSATSLRVRLHWHNATATLRAAGHRLHAPAP